MTPKGEKERAAKTEGNHGEGAREEEEEEGVGLEHTYSIPEGRTSYRVHYTNIYTI